MSDMLSDGVIILFPTVERSLAEVTCRVVGADGRRLIEEACLGELKDDQLVLMKMQLSSSCYKYIYW